MHWTNENFANPFSGEFLLFAQHRKYLCNFSLTAPCTIASSLFLRTPFGKLLQGRVPNFVTFRNDAPGGMLAYIKHHATTISDTYDEREFREPVFG